MTIKQPTIYNAIEERDAAEELAEEEAVMVTPAGPGVFCIRCREPITPKGWCPCKITRAASFGGRFRGAVGPPAGIAPFISGSPHTQHAPRAQGRAVGAIPGQGEG